MPPSPHPAFHPSDDLFKIGWSLERLAPHSGGCVGSLAPAPLLCVALHPADSASTDGHASGGSRGGRTSRGAAVDTESPWWLSAAAVSQSNVMAMECYYPAGRLTLDPCGAVGTALTISTHKDAARFTRWGKWSAFSRTDQPKVYTLLLEKDVVILAMFLGWCAQAPKVASCIIQLKLCPAFTFLHNYQSVMQWLAELVLMGPCGLDPVCLSWCFSRVYLWC